MRISDWSSDVCSSDLQSRPFAALSGLFDVNRIEVARGPQGTLYGRNSTGGAINIISEKPTDAPSGYLDLSFGNYSDLSLEGAISGPIVGDKLLARVSAKMQERDGYGTNATTDRKSTRLNSSHSCATRMPSFA